MDDNKIKVIYISGLGRSGSTLLDIIISTSPNVFSVGEIYRYNEYKNDDRLCSCGKNMTHCNFWSRIITRDIRIVNRANLKNYLTILRYLYFSKKKIGQLSSPENYLLLNQIQNNLPPNTDFILDSSKELGRLIELVNDNRLEVYNIHIVRDGRGTANSFNKMVEGKKPKNYFISLLKWIFVNKLIFRYLRLSQVKSLVISYDQFCENPNKYLKTIGSFIDIVIPDNYPEIIRLMDYHNLGGNRLARTEKRKEFSQIKKDDNWKINKGPLTRFLATIISYPFNKKWVYRKHY
ncbi:hypothetical protein ACFL04_02190 [Patescibacteria group bacterium]